MIKARILRSRENDPPALNSLRNNVNGIFLARSDRERLYALKLRLNQRHDLHAE